MRKRLYKKLRDTQAQTFTLECIAAVGYPLNDRYQRQISKNNNFLKSHPRRQEFERDFWPSYLGGWEVVHGES